MQPLPPLSIIVAVARENAIGYQNQLLCHLPDDLKYFKQTTQGNTVIMGKNTFLSLPGGALPGRVNVVLNDVPDESFVNCTMASSLSDALALCNRERENFVIGGGFVYRQFFPLAQKLYITHIDHTFNADTFFPAIEPDTWEEISRIEHPSDARHPYPFSFAVYRRR